MKPEVDDGPSDAVLEALWKRVLEAWDDDKAHAAFIDHAGRTDALAEAAGRYRARVDDPDKGPVAKKKLDAIVVLATGMLWSMKTPERGRVPLPITLSAFAISACLLGWLAWEVWGRR